jgi:hypothetical protein
LRRLIASLAPALRAHHQKGFPMRPIRPARLALAVLLAPGILPCADALAQGAHVHGLAKLQVAIDGASLAVTLKTPLDNLLGFERAPRDERERQAVAAMAAQLRSPDKLLLPSPAARCVLESVRLESPPLAGTPGHDGAAAGAAVRGEHGELSAQYRFRCAEAAQLRALEVRFFEAFRRLGVIDAQVAGPKRQAAKRLTARRPTLDLPGAAAGG